MIRVPLVKKKTADTISAQNPFARGNLRMLLGALAAQKRVIGALLMREIQVRWGRRNLGFAWLLAEPLVFAFPVLIMWRAMPGGIRPRMPLMAFLWSGYLPLLLFRHVTGHALSTIRNNGAVL